MLLLCTLNPCKQTDTAIVIIQHYIHFETAIQC